MNKDTEEVANKIIDKVFRSVVNGYLTPEGAGEFFSKLVDRGEEIIKKVEVYGLRYKDGTETFKHFHDYGDFVVMEKKNYEGLLLALKNARERGKLQ